MEEELEKNIGNNFKFHLAGIVPIACQPMDFKMPWHDSLMPIAPNYLAFERSVYECATVGCETIWIVAHRDVTPLLRHRLGDWIYDPTINPKIKAKYVKYPTQHLKQIPIYYVPIHPKDRDVRDGLIWSIFYGVKKAYHISYHFSKWVTPNRYYVSFPYSTYSVSGLKERRMEISSNKSFFIETPDGKTIKDGTLCGFSMSSEEYSAYLKNFRSHEKLYWKNGEWKNGKIVGEKLDVKERYTGRFIKPEQVFCSANIEGANIHKLKWYYQIDNWQEYSKYIGSANSKRIKRPTFGFEYHEFNPIAEDNDFDAGLEQLDIEFEST